MHCDTYAQKHNLHIVYKGYYLHMYVYIQYICILCINIHKVEYVYYACTMYTHSYTPDAWGYFQHKWQKYIHSTYMQGAHTTFYVFRGQKCPCYLSLECALSFRIKPYHQEVLLSSNRRE